MNNPYITNCDDGSMACEWIYPTLRVSISVEQDNSVIWAIVTKDYEIFDSGYMPEEFVKALRNELV